MKAMIDGIWYDKLPEGAQVKLAHEQISSFRRWITADGSSGFKAEPERYHLYVSYACPWAHRTILVRMLKRLEKVISISVLDPDWGSANGWVFGNRADCTSDLVNGCDFLHQIYALAKPSYTGRVTVPVLWDTQTGTIVSNESADIIQMLNAEFNQFSSTNLDLYPLALRSEIARMNEMIHDCINTGVYRAGFARTQAEYNHTVILLFDTLDTLNSHLHNKVYLVGNCLTEADIRLFVTLVRFDVVYYGALNCNLHRLVDYPHLWQYTSRLYQLPGVAETVKFDHIKRHYYDIYEGIINCRIVPMGPSISFECLSKQNKQPVPLSSIGN